LATRLGKSRTAITNTLRLLTLPPAIQHLLADGRLSAGHARALLGTPDRAFQEQLARRASQEGWSVRAVEDAVRQRQGDDGAAPDKTPASGGSDAPSDTRPRAATALRPPGLLELEELLAEHLATRVAVTLSGKRGRIAIDFADLEDLERIYHRMTSLDRE
jgi:ParB family transcriptional regulator, chromosome partitioning protein